MTAEFRPRLRAEAQVVYTGDGAKLDDPVLDRHIDVGTIGAEVLRRLDGTRTVAQVVDGLGTPATGLLRRLLLLSLLEGAGSSSVDKIRRLKNGQDELGYTILGDTRFSCQGSGQCCQNYVFGPLQTADIARINVLEPELRRAFPHLGEAPFIDERTLSDGTTQRFLRSVEDRCVFLGEDRRCQLHARFGAEAKPNLCRLYPLEQMATIDGVKIYDKGSCATFAVSARAPSLPLIDDLDRVRSLLPTEYELAHPVVRLAGDVLCDYGHFLVFVRRAIELTRQPEATAPVILRAAGRVLDELAANLAQCPLAAGEPENTVARTLTAGWPTTEGDPADVRRGAGIIADIASDLLDSVGVTIRGSNSDGKGWFSARLLREVAELLHLLQQLAMHASDANKHLLDGYYRELAEVRVTDPEIHDALRLSLRQQLFGYHALIGGRAQPALVRMGLIQLLALAGARLRASTEKRAPVVADLSYGHMLAVRLLSSSTVEAVLLGYESHASLVLEAIPALARL